VANASCGDPRRLSELLEDRLPADEQSRLTAHLDCCASCRRMLDHLAADGRWWHDLRAFVGPEAQGDDREGKPGEDLEEPALDILEPADEPGALGRFGPYVVLEVLGRGGMGVVLKALDPALHRLVAIKVMAPQLATSGSARRRFTREARAAASVSHDHVVSIHAVDEVRGLPFLVMPYIPGKSLQERIDATGPLALEEILRIGMQVAQGLAAAHAQGLIHRDIKPANILLENGVERVRITDFGLARAAADASLTQTGVVAGTPHYMAPEQARGEAVDHRSDLFSLGSVLYAMATGHPPFRAKEVMAVLRQVSDDEPPLLRAVSPEIPDWLAAIVARLHAKDPAKRFQSAGEVADLLARHLAELQQPLLTTQHGAGVTAGRKRGRTVTTWLPAAVLVLAAGLGASEVTGLTRVAGSLAAVLRTRRPDGKPPLKVVTHTSPALPFIKGPVSAPKAMESVWSLAVSRDGRRLVSGHSSELRIWDVAGWGLLARDVVPGHKITSVAFSPDGALIASVEIKAGDHRVVVRDGATGKVLRPLRGDTTGVTGAVFSPDGRELATWGRGRNNWIQIWDVAEGTRKRALVGHDAEVTFAVYAPDGKLLVSSSLDRTARVWNAATGLPVAILKGHDAGVQRVLFSPDSQTLATGSYDATIKLWNVADGRELATLSGHEAPVLAIAFSPDGKQLASAASRWGARYGYDPSPSEVRFWDVAERKTTAVMKGHESHVFSLAYMPDGKTLISVSLDRTMRLWDVASGTQIGSLPPALAAAESSAAVPVLTPSRTLPELGGGVWAVAYSPDGQRLIWGGHARSLGICEPLNSPPMFHDVGDGATRVIAFAPDGRTFAHGNGAGRIWLWDTESKRALATFKWHSRQIYGLAFSPDGKVLAAGGFDCQVKMWDLESGRELLAPPKQALPIGSLGFTPDGRTLVVATGSRTEPLIPGEVTFWDAVTAVPRGVIQGLSWRVAAMAIAPDGGTIATAGPKIRLWDAASGAELAAFEHEIGPFLCLAYSPDGRLLAGGSERGEVVIWDVATQRRWAILRGHRELVHCLTFAPDGRSIASGGLDNTLQCWDLSPRLGAAPQEPRKGATGALQSSHQSRALSQSPGRPCPALDLTRPAETPSTSTPILAPSRSMSDLGAEIKVVAYSPDGKRLLWGGDKDALVVCEPADGPPRVIPGGGRQAWALAFSPDGLTYAGADPSGLVWLEDADSKKTLAEFKWFNAAAAALAFSPDGKVLAAGGEEGRIKVWNLSTGREMPAPHLPAEPGLMITQLRFTPDGKSIIVATGSRNDNDKPGEVSLWDAATALPRGVIRGFPGKVASLAVAPDGRTIAAGSSRGIRHLDVASASVVGSLMYDDWQVERLEFCPDGRYLASGHSRGDVVIWELGTQHERAILKGHRSTVSSLAFAPNGRTLATGSWDSTVKCWSLAPSPGESLPVTHQ